MKRSKAIDSRYHKDKIQQYLNQGALILDVRSKGEWKSGHIVNAIHIELNEIPNNVNRIKELNAPIVVVCVSGVRSGQVAEFLKKHEIDTFNGGSWEVVAELINNNK